MAKENPESHRKPLQNNDGADIIYPETIRKKEKSRKMNTIPKVTPCDCHLHTDNSFDSETPAETPPKGSRSARGS